MNIKGLDFKLTCNACPEQYDVYNNKGKQVGYVRLRWGNVSCNYPDVGGKCIYNAAVGDGWSGIFKNEEQRMFHLKKIADAILNELEDQEELDSVKKFTQEQDDLFWEMVDAIHINGMECQEDEFGYADSTDMDKAIKNFLNSIGYTS